MHIETDTCFSLIYFFDRKEVDAIRGIANIHATITSLTMISKVSICLSLLSYVYFGNVITARKVFIVSSYFNILNLSMVYFWPLALTHVLVYTSDCFFIFHTN